MAQQIRKLGFSKNIEASILVNTKIRFGFSDSVLLLDKVLIHGIMIATDTLKSPRYLDVLPVADTKKAYLTLAGYSNEQYNAKFPLITFMDGASSNIFFIKPKIISIRNSFIELPDAGSLVIPASGYAITLAIFYDLYDEKIHKINSKGELINDTSE